MNTLNDCILEELNNQHKQPYLEFKQSFLNNSEIDLLSNLFINTMITEYEDILDWYQYINTQKKMSEELIRLNKIGYKDNPKINISLGINTPHRIYFLKKKSTNQIMGIIDIGCSYDKVLKQFMPEVAGEIRPDERDKGYGKNMMELLFNKECPDINQYSIKIYNDNQPSINLINHFNPEMVGTSTDSFTKKLVNHYKINTTAHK